MTMMMIINLMTMMMIIPTTIAYFLCGRNYTKYFISILIVTNLVINITHIVQLWNLMPCKFKSFSKITLQVVKQG